MKNFSRDDLSFSLCGLNCALCPMKLDGYCPGCGGGAGNQGCQIAGCSVERGGYAYCSDCEKYPCPKYDGITEFDSFITHRDQLSDMEKARKNTEAYRLQLEQKTEFLRYLLDNFNDGRRKTFFCLAVNLLELRDIQSVVRRLEAQCPEGMSLKEKAAAAADRFEAAAKQKRIVLKLNKKPSNKGRS